MYEWVETAEGARFKALSFTAEVYDKRLSDQAKHVWALLDSRGTVVRSGTSVALASARGRALAALVECAGV